MSWVYIKSEPQLYTVGFYTPEGDWRPESDWEFANDAAQRVHYLNGGSNAGEIIPVDKHLAKQPNEYGGEIK
jgi:hypothetical protein